MKIVQNYLNKKHTLVLCSAVFAFMNFSPAFAQVPDTATTTADPGRLQDQILEDGILPSLSKRVEVKEIDVQQAPAGAEKIKFVLKTIEFQGVSVYVADDLKPVYGGSLGDTVSLADVYAIAADLTNKYRNDGYILTQVVVPPQTIDGGVVKLRVIEGFIDNIEIEGAEEDETSMYLLHKYANGINTGSVLNIKDLERHILLIGDLPGVDARSILSPSKTTTGAADLKIVLTRDLHDAYLGVDNYGSRYIGPLEITASGSLNSYFGNNEKISLQFVGAPDPGTDSIGDLELGYYAISYLQPAHCLGLGTNLEFTASYTDTQPGYDLREFDVQGTSRYVSAKISHPFIRSRSTNLTGHALIDAREVSSRNNIQDTIRDNIRSFRVGGSYQAMDKFMGLGINYLNLELSKGLDIFGATSRNGPNISRALGDPEYTKLTGNLQRLQRVTREVNFLVAAKGQWASAPLLSSEEFGVGGSSIGRGYDSSEIIGDEGLAGKVELQWNNPSDIDVLDNYQVFGFYDVGRTWNKDATTSSQKKDIITSTGFGMRAEFKNEVKADLTFALPLNRNVQTQGDQGARVLFKLSRSF